MYMIVTLEVVYDHVGKYRKLALCYFIQINLILFCLTTIWKSEFQAKSHVIETYKNKKVRSTFDIVDYVYLCVRKL